MKIILILLILSINISFVENQKHSQKKRVSNFSEKKQLTELKAVKFVKDTILEKNNPKSIDLSKHQIFIDTTRNSIFYDKLRNWSESEWDKEVVKTYLNEINKNFKPQSIKLKSFPSHFITLRKLNNKFVLYNRCDGIDRRFVVRYTAIIFYGPLESDAESIARVITKSNKRIELELKTFKAKSNDEKSFLRIEKIDDFIYKIFYRNKSFKINEYLTTLDKINEFNMVVNHCPDMKIAEFDKFDNKKRNPEIKITPHYKK